MQSRPGLPDLPSTVPTSCVVPSVNVAVATNCCVDPCGTDAVSGLIASETICASVTVIKVAPTIVPDVAFTFEAPTLSVVASPALLIDAMVVSSKVQVAVAVRSKVWRA